ncbi:LAME_0E07272g1_1 [Lachancea meyersii CBS 8951]|uniref:LAME_0E07272g1_1 n=1 Tax=Lachancea meyersii CBS 8951 TaxID=1266667 RepID=A0A1G4JIL1_9SACH|nr:LAME_0E07272g1_1 [Lachancea meyersii CBS 8951]
MIPSEKVAGDDEFKKVGRTSAKLNTSTFEESLQERRCIVRKSKMFKTLQSQLEAFSLKIRQIRCLAIGSFFEEFAALYQLALLLELVDFLNANNETAVKVSIYDPVFTDADKKFIADQGETWSIVEEISQNSESAIGVLFFLPHAPLDLTENVLALEKPHILLANHVAKHVDRYTKAQLFNKYPKLAKLNQFLTSQNQPVASDFQPFVSKRARRKRKNNITEEPIDYDSIEAYFEKVNVLTDFGGGDLLANQPWLNSFSDLALHQIQ